MKVFTYLRVSGLGQVDKDGPQRQREAIATFCARHKLNAISEFFEEGVSGTVESMDRPKFSEMICKIDTLRQPIEAKTEASAIFAQQLFNIEAIVVERMDRLARDLMVSEFLLRECRARGIKVFCADQGELTDMASNDGDPTRVMFRQILGAIAQWEKSVTVKKLGIARLRRRTQTNECEGKKRYGRHNLDEFEIKQEIEKLHKEGLSFVRISDMFNARGIFTRHGKQWTKSNVFTIYSERRTKKRLLQKEKEQNEGRIFSIPTGEGAPAEGMLRGNQVPQSQDAGH